MSMPQRPREHVLEEESRVAFRALVEQDYGIDARVDLFDGGLATARRLDRRVDRGWRSGRSSRRRTNRTCGRR
jgi:hypothetical protein